MPRSNRRPLSLFLATLLLSASCASQGPSTPVTQASAEIPPPEVLDVGIEVLDPGLPQPDESSLIEEGIYPDLRRAEGRFIAVALAETMQSTGQWGPVRVVPAGFGQVDLLVQGRIIESNGFELVVEMVATDAQGREWIGKRFEEKADATAYAENVVPRDPFQNLYNRIANDLGKERIKLDAEERRELRTVSELRFASELAPAAFDGYLEKDRKGRWIAVHLPSGDDPMVRRVGAVRARDALLVDTLNEHYATFADQIAESYHDLRSYSYEEQLALKEIRRKARMQKVLGVLAIAGAVFATPSSSSSALVRDLALLGGIYAVRNGMALSAESKIHLEAVRELAGSFDAEVSPMLVEVEGDTLRLTGSAEVQYAQWRTMLQRIFDQESGLSTDPNDPAVAASPPNPE